MVDANYNWQGRFKWEAADDAAAIDVFGNNFPAAKQHVKVEDL